MQKLADRIEKELRTAKHCAVYEDELNRVWPQDGKGREEKIARFADEHGWRLRHYHDGFCAIFDKAPRNSRRRH